MRYSQDIGTVRLIKICFDMPSLSQIEVLSLVRRLAHVGGRSVVVVLHDINMAARFCDRIHALKQGRVVASGTPSEILAPKILHEVYGIEMDVISTPGLAYPLAYVC